MGGGLLAGSFGFGGVGFGKRLLKVWMCRWVCSWDPGRSASRKLTGAVE